MHTPTLDAPTMCDDHDHDAPATATDADARHGVTRTQAEDAVRTLLRWAGDDPA
jgi:hypothetical protein